MHEKDAIKDTTKSLTDDQELVYTLNVFNLTITYSTVMDDEKPRVSGIIHRDGRITWGNNCDKNIWIKGMFYNSSFTICVLYIKMPLY